VLKKVEPVDREVVEHQIINLLERRPWSRCDPNDAPYERSASHRSAPTERFAHIGEMRRPSSVLIDREFHASPPLGDNRSPSSRSVTNGSG
jgi:hypothetical protein